MSQNLNEAVSLLNDLLALGRTVTSVVDQARLDATVAALGDIALQDVERFSSALAADMEAAADALVEAAEQTARNEIEEAEQALRHAEQEAADQAEREERHAAGVS